MTQTTLMLFFLLYFLDQVRELLQDEESPHDRVIDKDNFRFLVYFLYFSLGLSKSE